MKLFVSLLALCVIIALTQGLSIKPPKPPTESDRGPIPKSKFTVITPNTIRRGKTFNAYVRGFSLKESVKVRLTLASSDNSYKVENDVNLSKDSSRKTVAFNTLLLPAGQSDFQFTVTSGNYTDTKSLTFISKQNSFFIQTNKAIFLPGDSIQFRIFSIDSEANAYNPTTPATVSLTDPRNNEIYKLDNLTFVNGKYENKFKLSSSPILGTWNFQVQFNGETVSKQLTVAEYVLPLFSASLSVQDQVSIASTKFPVTINAEYTFGEPVAGIASLTFQRYDDPTTYTKNVSLTSSSNTIEIDIKKDLKYTLNEERQFTISLVFFDPLSNTKATDQKSISIVPYTYIVQFVGDYYFKSNTNYNYKVAVQKLDGTPAPKGTKVTVTIQTQTVNAGTSSTATLTVGSDGFANGQLKTNPSITSFNIQATCVGGSNDYRGYGYASNLVQPLTATDSIQLSLLTPNPSYNDEILFQATVTANDVDNFIYFVTSKGVLLESSRIYFDYDSDDKPLKNVEFSIYSDFSYAPSFKIYAYYLKNNDWTFVSTSLFVQLKQTLPNYLTLSLAGADKTGNVVVKPSAEISLSVETNKYSTVSLYAIDQRVLLLKSGQNFTLNEVIDSFNGYSGQSFIPFRRFYNYDPYGASSAGLNFYTNIPPIPQPFYPLPMERQPAQQDKSAIADKSSNIQVRKNFLETFLWQDVKVYGSLEGDTSDYDSYDNRGREVIKAKVPDSITTYVVYGVSMSKYDGMGLPDSFPTATVFLPFFISMELPYSVKRNEVVIQSIIIFNYLKKTQKATITVAGDPKFEIVNADKYGWTVTNGSYLQQINCNDGSVRLTFAFRPKVVGFINLKVTAKGPLAGDAIEKVLKVIHEGVPRSVSSSVLLAIDKASNAVDKTLTCNLPASAYTDYAEVSSTVVGDILGKALNNLDKLITMPGGCGEQTLLGFVPDVVIYKYLKATNQLTAALQATLTQYLNSGYQNELKYQRNDGGFSAFGNSDAASSTWLTAYAAWSFYLSKDYIAISPAIIQSAVDFIVQQADTDGSFKEPGRVIHSDMQGAAGNGIALTAYVTIVLSTLATDYPSVKPQRDTAVQYLINKLNSVTDVYELGVIANALQIAGSNQANAAFNQFDAKKTETTTEIFWNKPAPQNQNYYGARSLDIEITAYGLRLLVSRNDNLANVIKVVKYLIGQSNNFGGYSSSQDTVMALAALSDFASTYTLTRASLNLQLTPNVGTQLNVKVDATNALTLQSFSLNEKARQLKIHPTGTGVAIVSLTCNYYDDPSKTVPSYDVSAKFLSTCQYRSQIEICVKSLTGSSSNMAIMEVRLPSGFIYQQPWWNQNANSDVSKIETYESNTVVVYYFNSISTKGTCVTLDSYRSGEVGELKPGTIEVNNYYDTSKTGSASFSVPTGDLNKQCYPIYY